VDWRAQAFRPRFDGEGADGLVKFGSQQASGKASEDARPSLFYLTTAEERARSKMAVVENSVLLDERVATAAKLFDCFQIDGDSLAKDDPLYESLRGRELPRFVAMRSDGKVAGRVEGSVSPSRVYSLLRGVAEREYVTRLDDLVNRHRKLLDELDKLNTKKQVLASKVEKSPSKETREILDLRFEIVEKEMELEKLEAQIFDVKKR